MTSVAPAPTPRLLVVGCGGIGGILTAHLLEQGHDVTALTTNTMILEALGANGFRVRGENSPGTVKGHAILEIPPGTRPFDYVFLATQPPQVEDAARRALPFLADKGAMVVFQNGLCEERIANIVGAERVLGAVVAWGASMLEPGVYDRTSSGGFVLGRLDDGGAGSAPRSGDGAFDPRLDELARILEAVGPTQVSANLRGARWSKLALNAAISSLGTVGGDRLGVLMRQRFVRRLALEIMTECVEVARALGIRLEKVSGTLDLEWIALTEAEKVSSGSPGLFAKHALLLAVGARYRRLRSSMLAAIERGRPPAIEFLNGEIVRRGEELGVPTPVNASIRRAVVEIANGPTKPGMDSLRRLYDATRPGAAPKEVPPPAPEAPAPAQEPPSSTGAP